MLLVALVALVAAPLVALAPEVEACQPYSVYCPFNGQLYHGCGTQVPGPMYYCIRDSIA